MSLQDICNFALWCTAAQNHCTRPKHLQSAQHIMWNNVAVASRHSLVNMETVTNVADNNISGGTRPWTLPSSLSHCFFSS